MGVIPLSGRTTHNIIARIESNCTTPIVPVRGYQLFDFPRSGFDTRSHGGRGLKTAVDTHKVVPAEMQVESRQQVVIFLRECVGEAGKASHLHTHGQILAFDVGR